MQATLIVFLGAGIGGALRHGTNMAAARLIGSGFPWGTLAVNILGSFVMGVLAGYLAFKAGTEWTQHARLFLATGVLGGFTTFSAFSLDVALMMERQQLVAAGTYVAASVLGSVGALFLGLWLTRTTIA